MQLEHTFTVPVAVDEAFAVLRDLERVAPCMPGATLDRVEGEEFTGRVKVKVGPMQMTYKGSARFVDVDEDKHRATIEASGTETRGAGTARATVTAEMAERDGRTEVRVVTDLVITGRPAQFGRGVMADVGEKLLGQFADCLSRELAEREVVEEAAAEPPPGAPLPEPEPRVVQPRGRPTPEAVDLLDVAGAPVARRVLPVLAALALVAVVVWLIRRR